MTIQRALELLEALKAKHGADIEVFYDCEHCGKSTRPETVVAVVALRSGPDLRTSVNP